MPLLDEDAYYRILVWVGPEHFPADFNLGGLRWELESLASHYTLGGYHRRASSDRRRNIDKAIAALENIDPPPEELIAHLKPLRSPVDQLPDISFGVREGSAFEILVGRWLKDTFEKYFRRKPTMQGTAFPMIRTGHSLISRRLGNVGATGVQISR